MGAQHKHNPSGPGFPPPCIYPFYVPPKDIDKQYLLDTSIVIHERVVIVLPLTSQSNIMVSILHLHFTLPLILALLSIPLYPYLGFAPFRYAQILRFWRRFIVIIFWIRAIEYGFRRNWKITVGILAGHFLVLRRYPGSDALDHEVAETHQRRQKDARLRCSLYGQSCSLWLPKLVRPRGVVRSEIQPRAEGAALCLCAGGTI
ncbi:hypothetical protein EJ08DRAFT_361569 [Tothia fuscella]|uniref:Uncharacterized protein n=1 Tax=Tothia fuscella TaxID=1048955 RepID=A0A9P4NLI6_9PEZI|nr:hypothetical protein EJ08DRAFT_361569 [Tothia fuscella]